MNHLVIFISIILQAKAAVFYVSPDPVDNATCFVNGMTVRPCYALCQYNQTLLLGPSSISLLLLQGIHVIPKNHNFVVTSTDELHIHPWDEQSEVEIQCQVPAQLTFQDIDNVSISSINFLSCAIEYKKLDSGDDKDINTLHITNSVFSGGLYGSVVTTTFAHVYISNCIFNSTPGAVSCKKNEIFSLFRNKVFLIISDSVFFNNTRELFDGGALYLDYVDLTLIRCQFTFNKANSGGAIYALKSELKIESCVFETNSAMRSGGAIYSEVSPIVIERTNFLDNKANVNGGALCIFDDVDFRIANVSFTSNQALLNGGAVYCSNFDYEDCSTSRIKGELYDSHLTLNSAVRFNGGFAYLSRCDVSMSEVIITNNSAVEGGAIYADESSLNFLNGRDNIISHNIAEKNGGSLFLSESNIRISYYVPLTLFYNNTVTSRNGKGGAIFVRDKQCTTISYPDNTCPLSYDYEWFIKRADEKFFLFLDNKASQGSVLYGGLLDRCLPSLTYIDTDYHNAIEIFKNISEFQTSQSLAISSLPLKACICTSNSAPDCTMKELHFTKMRGQRVKVLLVVLDQDDHPVPSVITAAYTEPLSAQLKQGERSFDLKDSCTELEYHIFSVNPTATLVLQPSETPCTDSPLSTISLNITLLPCSKGFQLDGNTCVCDPRLVEFFNITECDIDTQTLQRKGLIWLRYGQQDLKLNTGCPLDYCQVSNNTVNLSSPDDQCVNNHGGVLCGACKSNYSIALGGSKCLRCSNNSYNFIWLTIVFAVAGLALVAFLLVCNITISAGTLNGLIFYANIVSASILTSLRSCSIHPTLSVFISWVNLDFGVETCFFSGMDTYTKVWLQLAFPLYIWLLVAAIIVTSYYSPTAMKLFGRNNIAILATLFLLSYSKLLKIILTALSFTHVYMASAENVHDPLVPYKVWTYDGNIEYLKGRHIALFIMGCLLLLFVFLPYTLMLLFGQCVRSMHVRRGRRGLQWTRSTAFISIMDAYHAPYSKRHRYWTGLMLLIRCVLFLALATLANTNSILLTNTFTVTLVVVVTLVAQIFLSKIYKKVYVHYLEVCFLLNLTVLSATLYYLIGNGSEICTTLTISISISFALFLSIVAYHAYLRVTKSKYYTSSKCAFLSRRRNGHPSASTQENSTDLDVHSLIQKPPTTTTIDVLREELLEVM